MTVQRIRDRFVHWTLDEELREGKTAMPWPDDDVLDWDTVIEAPRRVSGTISVRLCFRGRAKPIPSDDDPCCSSVKGKDPTS